MDLRLKSVPYELDGKTYQLRCNMAVLMDVQEAFDGDLTQALSRAHSMRGLLEFLAAMLNDFADEQGWTERWTARQLGRRCTWMDRTGLMDTIADLIHASLQTDTAETDTEPEKNGATSQS